MQYFVRHDNLLPDDGDTQCTRTGTVRLMNTSGTVGINYRWPLFISWRARVSLTWSS